VPPADSDPADSADLDALYELAVHLARQAGELLADGQRRARATIEMKSSLTDMVTEMDRAAEALILETLERERPNDAVLAEEGGVRAGSSGIRWVVDPLDGTTNYLYGYPPFAVSIAAEVGGTTAVGVVHDVVHGETFGAIRGRGAWCNGAPIRPSGLDDVGTALVGTGFAYVAERRQRQAAVLREVLPWVRDIRRGGSAAVDLCYVACGRLDAYYEQGLAPWDLAAGKLIVTEAGGHVGELDDGPPPTVVAATAALAEPLQRLLQQAM
jgi:myo-inositol-1(or 4)-monophosphatase